MSTGQGEQRGAERPPTEEEMRAAYEAQVKKIRVEHVLLEDVVTLINLGMRRTGLVEGTEAERDPEQVRLAVEAVRAVLPLLEQAGAGEAGGIRNQLGQIRDALSQLQLAYVRIGGQPPEAARAAGAAGEGEASGTQQPPPAPKPGEPGPAQRTGKLWVPGQ